jgi:TolA-binding protein
MNPTVKFLLYVVLLGGLAVLGYRFYDALHAPEPGPKPTPATPSSPVVGTDTNQPVVTAGNTNNPPDTNATNVAAVGGTTPPASNRPPSADDEEMMMRRPSARLGQATAYGVTMFFLLVGLGILIGRDVSRYFAGKMQDFIFNDNLEGMKDPEYEEAEQVWATGDHLEAVRLMRTYLNRHPREQYVALRIAEIYETNLNNHLAAALEYEEVLKKKLPAERWGWAAIHLANLYSGKLDKIPEATALLRRIVDEYGQTAAAKKARERLGIPEPVPEPTPAADPEVALKATPASPITEAEAPESEPTEAEKPPSHNLPKGFRPK